VSGNSLLACLKKHFHNAGISGLFNPAMQSGTIKRNTRAELNDMDLSICKKSTNRDQYFKIDIKAIKTEN